MELEGKTALVTGANQELTGDRCLSGAGRHYNRLSLTPKAEETKVKATGRKGFRLR